MFYKQPKLYIPSSEELAWIVGFWEGEGEGSIGCYLHKRKYGNPWILNMCISQKDKTPLIWIQKSFMLVV